MSKLIFTSCLFLSMMVRAEALSNLAVYNRCYAQLTGQRPLMTATVSQQVANGTLNPITACLNLLNSVSLTGNSGTTIGDTYNAEAKAVLRQMHNLHASWLYKKDFNQIETIYSQQGIRDFVDSSSPALYFTRALFASAPNISTVLNNNDILRPVRSNNDPATGPASILTKSSYYLQSQENGNFYGFQNQIFASTGDLLGLKAIAKTVFDYRIRYPSSEAKNYTPAGEQIVKEFGSQEVYASAGGGIVGFYPYLLMNSTLALGYFADGGVKMPRRWARSVFNDLLCRDLPAVRIADASPFVVSSSSVPFRKSSSCVVCHASMDRAAFVVRNLGASHIGSIKVGGEPGLDGVRLWPITKPAESAWPVNPDKDFYSRPTNGVFYFRNYQGALVDMQIAGPQELANAILAQDDFYICVAKRYYQHFTGIAAPIGDLDDPNHPPITDGDRTHRNIVINLGLSLKQTKNPKTLIKEIMELSHYKQSGFGQ